MTRAATVLIGILFLPFACTPANRTHSLSGRTMGTTYSIRIADKGLPAAKLANLQREVDAVLAAVNHEMSTYDTDSEISGFNRSRSTAPRPVAPDFALVVRRSLEFAEATDGAFDPTVGPLVNLWGFGPQGRKDSKPTPEQVAAARETVGYKSLSVSSNGWIAKALPALEIDLSAVAKGFGVDKVASLLRERGLRNFVVEIGGETVADGVNAQGEPWRVGVLKPDYTGSVLQGVVHLTGGRAIATSGDYRNFYRAKDGTTYAHIIDPRTGAPLRNEVASVSVLAGNCLTADGLATALALLGPTEGMRVLASRFPGVEALFILRHNEARFEEVATPGFAAALHYEH